MARFGDDVVGVIETLSLERMVLIGHSMGGDVMVEFAPPTPRPYRPTDFEAPARHGVKAVLMPRVGHFLMREDPLASTACWRKSSNASSDETAGDGLRC
jgi:pimeloyl-ACP methyl ester carboxylesterase